MIPRITIILLNSNRMRLTNNIPLFGQYFSKHISIIGAKNTVFQMINFAAESSKRCSITVAKHPSNTTPREPRSTTLRIHNLFF
jgi:hypothetical protein